MKYTLLGFSQQRALELGLDMNDLTLLRWFVDFQNTNRMKIEIVNGQPFYWVQYDHIREDLPLLGLKKDSVYRRLKVLAEKGVLKRYTLKQNGTYSYYALGDLYESLVNSPIGLKSEPSGYKSEGYGLKSGGGTENNPEGYGLKSGTKIPLPDIPLPEDNKTPLTPHGGEVCVDENFSEKALNEKNSEYTQEFESFWEVYPAKSGKFKAFEAFKEAKKKTPVSTLIEGAKRYRAWCDHKREKDPNHKIKYAQGWLNARRWEDEYDTDQSSSINDAWKGFVDIGSSDIADYL